MLLNLNEKYDLGYTTKSARFHNTCKVGLILTKTQCLQTDGLGEGDKDMVGPYMI